MVIALKEFMIQSFLKRGPRNSMPIVFVGNVCVCSWIVSMEAGSVQGPGGFPAPFSGQRQPATFSSLPSPQYENHKAD